MLTAAYIVSALLEIGGLALTVRDVMRAQGAAVLLADPPESEPVTKQEAARSPGGSLTDRAYRLGQKRDRERADQHQRDVLGRILPEGRFRPYVGPGLIALGIIVGAIADICSS